MPIQETGKTIRLDTGYFRADFDEYSATFWKVLGAKSNSTRYLIRPSEIDELLEMLQGIRARWLGQPMPPAPRQLSEISWKEFFKAKFAAL